MFCFVFVFSFFCLKRCFKKEKLCFVCLFVLFFVCYFWDCFNGWPEVGPAEAGDEENA